MQTNKEALIEFLKGGAVGFLIVGMFIGVIALVGTFEGGSIEKFKIVDLYNGCNVVRYNDDTSRYHYFLDCKGSENRP